MQKVDAEKDSGWVRFWSFSESPYSCVFVCGSVGGGGDLPWVRTTAPWGAEVQTFEEVDFVDCWDSEDDEDLLPAADVSVLRRGGFIAEAAGLVLRGFTVNCS
eukprot:s319_g13.t1